MESEPENVHTGRKVGYLRVSSSEQRPDRQIDGLKNICDELHVEIMSAVKDARPVFNGLIGSLKTGDTLVVWDLDRAFRSTQDALRVADTLQSRGVNIEIVRLRMDTSLPEGFLMYAIMAAVGEFERRNLVRRTCEGLAAARLRGKRLGRPPKLSDEQLAAIRAELSETEVTITAQARRYGVAPWTLTRSLRRAPRAGRATPSD